MRAFRRSLIVVAAAGLVAVGAGSAVWAQGSDWKAPADAKNVKNQRADKKNDKAAMANAQKLVETNCQTCHGASGKGDGPAAAALQPKPADWTSAKIAKETDGELFWKISNGRGPMPPWKHLPDQERWEIVNYIRTLQKK